MLDASDCVKWRMATELRELATHLMKLATDFKNWPQIRQIWPYIHREWPQNPNYQTLHPLKAAPNASEVTDLTAY